jgi:FliI/YscN family ATPase
VSVAPDAAFLASCRTRLAAARPLRADGRVCSLVGNVIEGEGLRAPLGAVCSIEPEPGSPSFVAEVVGFRGERMLLMPLVEQPAVGPGARIRFRQLHPVVAAGEACLGRVLDGLGAPLDGGPPLVDPDWAPLYRRPEHPLRRERVRQPLDLGVRALNALATVGRGARIGIFAGSGVGKSSLLGQIARFTSADVNVIALVGERGREVRDFIEGDLGDALARSVVVVATGDQAPLLRVRAAHAATAIAERFRDSGRHVLLLMDSVTRFCMAQREIGLAAGEPPTTRGYTPSVWSRLPRLLERAGTAAGGGSITGIYSVLVEGDDPNEPVADAARAILDGHVLLSRELAEHGHFPAIDVLASVSRVMPDVTGAGQQALARRARELLATYRRAEDLISIGAYVAGSDPRIDEARRLRDPLNAFLRQGRDERASLEETRAGLAALLGGGTAAGTGSAVVPAGGVAA